MFTKRKKMFGTRAEQPKKRKEKKQDNTDLLSLGPLNLNQHPTLAEDYGGDAIIGADIYPPDPQTVFDAAELLPDEPGAPYWQLSDVVKNRFPLLSLRIPVGDGEQKTMAFVDESYGCGSSTIGGIAPPTWMDPEIFVRLALQDEAIAALVNQAVAANSLRGLGAIKKELQRVFDSDYLAYSLMQFEKVSDLLARWMVARKVWTDDNQINYHPGPEKPLRKPKESPK